MITWWFFKFPFFFWREQSLEVHGHKPLNKSKLHPVQVTFPETCQQLILCIYWQCRSQEEPRVKEALAGISNLCSITPSKGKWPLRGCTNCISDLRRTETHSEGTTDVFLFLLKAELQTASNDNRNNHVGAHHCKALDKKTASLPIWNGWRKFF